MGITHVTGESDGGGGSRTRTVDVPLFPADVEGYTLHVSAPVPARDVMFVEIPDGQDPDTDWHNAPQRQYVVVLSGVVEFETSDGVVGRLGPGDVSLAADVTGRGHRSRNVETPLRLMFVTLADGAEP